jgi:preprotein translocase subunit SecD
MIKRMFIAITLAVICFACTACNSFVSNEEQSGRVDGVSDFHLTFRDPEGNIILDGSNVVSVKVKAQKNAQGYYEVMLKFDKAGTDKLAAATTEFFGQQIGVYLNENLLSSPVVRAVITDGEAVIVVSNKEEAEQFAAFIPTGKD